MDFLTTYLSEESEEDELEEPKNKIHKKETENDFFNLQSRAVEEETDNAKSKTIILDNFDLMMQTKILSCESYGPPKLKELSIPKIEEPYQHKNSNIYLKNIFKSDSPGEKYSNKFNESLSNARVKETDIVIENNISEIDTKLFSSELENYYVSKNTSFHGFPLHKSASFSAHKSAVTSLQWCRLHYSHLLLTSSIDSNVKLWNMNSNKCVFAVKSTAGVKAAKWSLSGTSVVYGGYDKKATICDIFTEKDSIHFTLDDYVSSVEVHPEIKDVYLVGTKNAVFAFDKRQQPLPIRTYLSNCKYVLDIAFLAGGQEFVCSTEIVSHDSADRTLMVWDFATGAILSNQIYAERYTCPSVSVQSEGMYFAAQSNGDYLVIFANKRPYKMVNRRYAGHKVSGYNIGCDFNPDGSLLASGDADGALFIYSSQTGKVKRRIEVNSKVPTVQVRWHPILKTTIASAGWDGSVQIWK